MSYMSTKKAQAVAALRDTIERFITAAEKAASDHVALKKMLEISVEVQPAMEEVVKAATGKEYG
jgi:hypothetical protein